MLLFGGATHALAQTTDDDGMGVSTVMADETEGFSLTTGYVECYVSTVNDPYAVALSENTTNRSPLIFLGPPDGLFLGLGGRMVTFDLLDATLLDLPGPDFNVYEIDRGLDEFALVDVLVSADGVTFTSVKSTEGPVVRIPGDGFHSDDTYARSYDIGAAGLGSVKYIRLDGAGTDPVSGCCSQFDLDAIGLIHYEANPVDTLCEDRGVFPIGVKENTTGHTCLAFSGPPDDLYIGIGGQQVTLDFGTVSIVDEPGADFNVYEVDWGMDEFASVDVLVSLDGVNFTSVKSSEAPVAHISGDEQHSDDSFARSYDLAAAGLGLARFVRLDGTGTGAATGCCTGFDLDAVGAIHAESDQDGDGLATCDEVTRGTDPLSADTDGDGLEDGAEVGMSDFGDCPSPLIADSDGDGLNDATEVGAGTNPCDADSDGDLLADGMELAIGTDPWNPDTDGDGLSDGVEMDVAEGGSCPNPLSGDSDGDTLSDGVEVDLGTSPCLADTDADGLTDDVDPLPLTPNSSVFVEAQLRALCTTIESLSLDRFEGPNDKARKGRRNAICNKLNAAANSTAAGDYQDAIDQLHSLLLKLDDVPKPRDWMSSYYTVDKAAVRTGIEDNITLLLVL